MVQAGYAWVYDEYVSDISFYKDQEEARGKGLGIWKNENVVQPWEWRKLRNYRNLEINDSSIECCKICKKGKACGDSCINKAYVCSRPKGCACNAN